MGHRREEQRSQRGGDNKASVFHVDEVGRAPARHLILPAKKLIFSAAAGSKPA
jgi:hypothetical protein